MSLQYQDLWGNIVDREQLAIDLIKKHEPVEEYWVAFSGGKDSIVILDLVKRAHVKYEAYFHMTTIDPPEVLQFIKDYYPDVNWIKPKNSMYKIILKKRFPPTRQIRYCCEKLKEIGGEGRVVVLGIRKEESNSRRERREYEQSTICKTKWFVNPILEWSTQDVWDYIKKHSLPCCSLYDQGYTRIGCIMYPLQGSEGMIKDANQYPHHYRAFLNTFRKMLTIKRENKSPYQWKNAEDVMYWWIYGKSRDGSTIQEELLLK